VLTSSWVTGTLLKSIKDQLANEGVVQLTDIALKFELTLQFILDTVLPGSDLLSGENQTCKLEKDVLISIQKEQDQEKTFTEIIGKIDTPQKTDSIFIMCGAKSQTEKEKVVSVIKTTDFGKLH
jgi:hypothetical protein